MAISSSETAFRVIMGKNEVTLKITIFLIFYIILSIFWANRLVNEKRFNRSVRRQIINQTLMKKTNITWQLSRNHSFGVRTLPIENNQTYKRLKSLLQSASNNLENLNWRYTPVEFENYSRGNSMIKKDRISTSIRSNGGSHSHSNTCLALVSGNEKLRQKTIRIIKEKHKVSEPQFRSDDVIAGLFGKCKSILKFVHASADASDRKQQQIAFSILLNRPADQTLQLLRSIYDPSNLYCLHVDLHATKKYLAIMRKISACLGNVLLSPKRFDIAYPTVDRIKAHVSCFERMLNSSVQWRYLITLPGSVFPLRNVTILSDFLSKRDYVNGIASKLSNNPRFLRRVKFVHEIKRGLGKTKILFRTKKRLTPPPDNMTLFRSENNFFVTRDFVEFVINSREAKELLLWSKDARNPEEFYWATLDRLPGAPGGSPHRNDIETTTQWQSFQEPDVNRIQDNDLVVRLWKGTRGLKCGGIYHRNMCIFNYVDLRWLLSHDNLFAGPFDIAVDRTILECLYQNLRKPLIKDFGL